MASTYLSRSISSTGNTKTATISVWIKRGNLTAGGIFTTGSANTDDVALYQNDTSVLLLARVSGTAVIDLTTERLFRDVNGWYHYVWTIDTTEATQSDRVKFYVNGEQITDWNGATTYPSQNQDIRINESGYTNYIGNLRGSGNHFDGSMSHFHLIDGTAYQASTFGSTDSTTGEWRINPSPNVTYGTNGFFILKDGNNLSGSTVQDQSGNSNNFTVAGGTLTNTEDNPSNVFATINAANKGPYFAGTLSTGNLSHTGITAGNYYTPGSTLRVSSGKYYAEFKCQSATNWTYVGIDTRNMNATNDWIGKTASGWSYLGGSSSGGSNSLMHNNSQTSYGDSYTTNDIIGIALDLDNKKLYFHKNGTYQNGGVPTSGATGTGAIDISTIGNDVYFGASNWSGTYTAGWRFNFGNGYFGTSAVSSAGTNASGIGIFEYDVPTGYTALCTKGLNE